MNVSRLAKKASQLRINAISLAENMRNGGFKSLYRGQGIVFSDVREYLPGDNVRAIDWNVTARMGRAFIKQYEEDRELVVFFILDCSASMENGFSPKSKHSQALETAALLLLAAEHNYASVGAVFFDGKILFSLSPKSGKENTMTIFSKLDKIDERTDEEKSSGSALVGAIQGAEKLLKKRSLVFVISDFRTTFWEDNIARLAQKHDVVAIKITSSEDEKPGGIGTMTFFDPESKKIARFPTHSKRFQKEWLAAEEERRAHFADFCSKHGIRSIFLPVEKDAAVELSRFFKSK